MSSSRRERDLRRDDVLTSIQSVLVVVVVAVFAVAFVLQPFRIPSESMDPTLRVGDFLLMNKQALAPHGRLDFLMPHPGVRRGEIVVFHYPVDPAVPIIKRVVAVPGDRLRMHGAEMVLNGAVASEPYAVYVPAMPDAFRDDFPTLHAMDRNVDPAWWGQMRHVVQAGELHVPQDAFFVMGDNRNDSEDSRYWGFVPREALVGEPMLVYFSLGPMPPNAGLRRRIGRLFGNIHRVR